MRRSTGGAREAARAAARRWATAVAVALGLGVVLSACVAIPTSGPIGRGDVAVAEPGVPIPIGADPVPDASPEDIVRGFLQATAGGVADEFTVARNYLSRTASAEWEPRAELLIYARGGGPVVEERDEGSVRVTVPVAAVVDSGGRYTEVVPGSQRELVFELRRDARQQWRITDLADAVLLSEPNFRVLYRPTPVYFATPDQEHLVPDLRWFPVAKNDTYAVAALLAGPSPWLQDAVVSGAPAGAQLSTGSVTVSSDSVAAIDLTSESNQGPGADRDLLQAQLEATLPRVAAFEVTAGGLPWQSTRARDLRPDVAPERGPGPYVLSGDRLALVDRGRIVPVEDAAPLTGLGPESPALSPDLATRVVLARERTQLVLLPPGAAAPETLLSGEDLLAPTVDRFGWVWTGERTSAGQLLAALPNGTVTSVSAPWLEGRSVQSIRVSRDGARMVVVSTGPAGVTVAAAGVIRDETGRPSRLGEGLPVGAVLDAAGQATWVDEITVAVLGRSDTIGVDTVHLIPLGGPTEVLALREGTRSIAAGRGVSALYLADAEGNLLARQNSSWRVVPTDASVRDPVFPG